MSITDDVRPAGRAPADPPPPGGPGGFDGQFDKTPPQDVAAEQCVLGGMLLSKDAIADVVEILKPGDFYRPVHATIFDAVLDLYGRGEPADPITVAAALADTGDLGRVGGAPYLHTLIASVPTAANASYYARIVGERAVLRRLVEAGTRIVQLGYGAASGAGRDVDDVVDLAQQAVYDVTERRVSEDFAVLADMLQPTLDEIEAVGSQGGVMTGVPTGFTDLDRLLNGLHAGQLVIVAGRPGLGKALATDTPIPTPSGWTTMGEVQRGDQVLGADGKPTTVVHAFDVMRDRPCFEVEFSDGSTIIADADHLWRTTTRASRRQQAEQKRTHQWPEGARKVVAQAHRAALAGPDTLVTFGEAVGLVGKEFRHVLHLAGADVGFAGRVTREYRRAGKPWTREIQAYSWVEILSALSRRVDRLRNAETRGTHPDVVTTAEIAATLRHPADGRHNHAVENSAPLSLPHRHDLPVAPYTLGVWLGDGHADAARFTSADPEMAAYIEADGFQVRPGVGLTYTISVPALAPVPARDCVVCGTRFTPRGPSVYTCGRSCGGKARAALIRSSEKVVRRAGARPMIRGTVAVGVRPATGGTDRSSVTCGLPACSGQAHPRQLPSCLRSPTPGAARGLARYGWHRGASGQRPVHLDLSQARRGCLRVGRVARISLHDQQEACQRPPGRHVDRVHAELQHCRRGLPAGTQAPGTSGAASGYEYRSVRIPLHRRCKASAQRPSAVHHCGQCRPHVPGRALHDPDAQLHRIDGLRP
ncbi:hypothetical protein Pflav_070350 [Phytohabitans flavus]|uniref:Replicative DNA helicase DnaB n=1 Tax=Phytohabitans flavus TaxID=1076124 RepID=A0A6F8Y3F4_9ACTN|nr:hypothetical protein Pflav_070350 [Phytohabitans flavus]